MTFQFDKELIRDKLRKAGVAETLLDSVQSSVEEVLASQMGNRLEDELSEKQVSEFAKFVDKDDTAGAEAWLTKQFPDYDKWVNEELDAIIQDLKGTVDKMLSVLPESQ